MYNALFAQLEPSAVVLTITHRLSDYLNSQYDNYDILPAGDWLKRCWREYADNNSEETCYLLTNAQEFTLWQQIIRHSEAGNRLLQVNATTELARQAWQLMKQWQLPLDAVFNQTEDTMAWQAWAKTFMANNEKNNWLDINSLPDKLIALLTQQKFSYKQKIVLLGFDELNPQYQLLFKQLSAQGCDIIFFTPSKTAALVTGIKLNDSASEMETMARWAKHIQKQAPEKTIGCIIPNLNEIYSDIVNVFTEILAPAAHLPGCAATLPFNLSSQFILSHYPIIHTALTMLGLYKTLNFNKVSALLRAPYLGHAEQEMSVRARLDVALRQRTETFLTLRELLVFAKKYHCPLLARLLNDYSATLPTASAQLYPSQWADLFSWQLTALGWPGERSLNRSEYQLVERWQVLLGELAQFDFVLHKISLDSALNHLQQIAGNIVYQPQNAPANIYLLTPLEAAGLQFDYLWVMGLDDNAWPPVTNPNPFLPIALQRKYKLPHASSEQALQFYQQMTRQLMQSAGEIIISYPQFNSEHTLRPSALVSNITSFEQTDLNLPALISLAKKIRQNSQLETYEDHLAPAVNDSEKIAGGSAIFKYQALCPFRAFAQFRLGAQALSVPHEGLNARERGSILHRALEIIWGQLNDQQQLLTKTEEELTALIQQTIDTTLLDFIKQRPHIFKVRFTHIEKTRLQRIISAWLELEKQRPPFTVHKMEETCEAQIGNISLKIRIDRIDQLADGDYIIFDYKTSPASINCWFSDRPDDPQLPLYISTSRLPINGLAFAVIRSNNVHFKGISASDFAINGIATLDKSAADFMCNDWPVLLAKWQRVLTELATQFTSGKAHCDPKNGQQTCRLCDLQTLCRVAEQH